MAGRKKGKKEGKKEGRDRKNRDEQGVEAKPKLCLYRPGETRLGKPFLTYKAHMQIRRLEEGLQADFGRSENLLTSCTGWTWRSSRSSPPNLKRKPLFLAISLLSVTYVLPVVLGVDSFHFPFLSVGAYGDL